MNKIWIRAGMALSVTEAEADDIIGSCGDAGGDNACRKETLTRVIKEGRFAFDGESYVPGICVEEYNRANGTNYDEYDVETDLEIPASEISVSATNRNMAIYALIENWADAGNDILTGFLPIVKSMRRTPDESNFHDPVSRLSLELCQEHSPSRR